MIQTTFFVNIPHHPVAKSPGRWFGGALGRPSAGGRALSYLVRLCRAAHLLRGGGNGQEAPATCYGGAKVLGDFRKKW